MKRFRVEVIIWQERGEEPGDDLDIAYEDVYQAFETWEEALTCADRLMQDAPEEG